VSETVQFIAMPFDQAEEGLVAGAFFKCKSPESAIERAKDYGRSSDTPARWPLSHAQLIIVQWFAWCAVNRSVRSCKPYRTGRRTLTRFVSVDAF
jgi:hypothetical protein